MGGHTQACTHTHSHSFAPSALRCYANYLSEDAHGCYFWPSRSGFLFYPRALSQQFWAWCLVSTAPLTSRAVPCQALCQTARRGGKEVSDSRLADSLAAFLKGPLLQGRGRPRDPASPRAAESSTPASACLHFHLGSVSPLTGHGTVVPLRRPPQSGQAAPALPQPVSAVGFGSSFAVHFGSGEVPPLCLPLDVLFKRPLIPGTQ